MSDDEYIHEIQTYPQYEEYDCGYEDMQFEVADCPMCCQEIAPDRALTLIKLAETETKRTFDRGWNLGFACGVFLALVGVFATLYFTQL